MEKEINYSVRSGDINYKPTIVNLKTFYEKLEVLLKQYK